LCFLADGAADFHTYRPLSYQKANSLQDDPERDTDLEAIKTQKSQDGAALDLGKGLYSIAHSRKPVTFLEWLRIQLGKAGYQRKKTQCLGEL
jgi:hypothetical protein